METEVFFSSLFFLPSADTPHVYVHAWTLHVWTLCSFHGLISIQTFAVLVDWE